MDLEITLVPIEGAAAPVTVRVEATPDATGLQLADALRPLQPVDGPLHLGEAPLDARPLSEIGLLHGARLGIGGPLPASEVPLSGPRLHVEAGPATGAVIALPADGGEIGRAGGITIADRSLSRPHAALRPTAGRSRWRVEDLDSTNGTAVEGQGVGRKGVEVDTHTPIVMGATSLVVVDEAAEELACTEEADGTVSITRPMRNVPLEPEAVLTVPEKALDPETRRFPVQWVALAVPLLMAGALVLITKRPQYALFALMGPVSMLGTTFAGRRSGKKEVRADRRRFDAETAQARDDQDEAVRDELTHLRRVHPGPGTVTEMCLGPTGRLWERGIPRSATPGDDGSDLLDLWVGSGPTAARTITFEGERTRRVALPVVHEAPVTVDLDEVGVVGVFGSNERTRAVARSLVLQAAALHGPDDLSLVLVARDAAHRDWEWIRWLPHTRSDDGSVAAAIDGEATGRVLKDVATVIESRRKVRESASGRQIRFPTVYVVVVEDASRLRANASLGTLLEHGPSVGVSVVCLEDGRARVPRECRAAIAADPDVDTGRSRIEHRKGPPTEDVNLGALAPGLAERCARALAPRRVAEAPREGDALAGPVRLLDLLDMRSADPDTVRAVWDAGGRTTEFVIGVTVDGPFRLDLRLDGPHGLVAGTTGAGKSQLLMTMVTSLAFANTPEDLNFVLVDFKGGGAFGPCQGLPHTTGVVTNLDGGGAQRAIRSLAAEAARRSAILSDFGGDLDTYEDARRHDPGRGLEKIPRLVIVVDEFAQLAKSHEELMGEFINVAQVGRSLGMSMILATQRPTGIITGQIQSNTELRVALRVAEVGDSIDVIGSPVASTISKRTPGRAHIQTANGLIEVQTAAVGIPQPGVVDRASVEARPSAWVDVVRPPEGAAPVAGDPTQTDLYLAVQLIGRAVADGDYAIPPPPFLPELDPVVTVGALGGPIAGPGRVSSVPIGLVDLTHEQSQVPLMWHPAAGSLIVAGSPQTGRSTALRTVAAQVAAWTSPEDVHLYAIDMGSTLRSLEALPHCGAVVSSGQISRASRLVARVEAEVARRLTLLERHGVADVTELREQPGAESPPYIVVMVDQWHLLYEKRTSGAGPLVDALVRLARDGGPSGVSVVVAGDARSTATLAPHIREALVLRQNAAHEVDPFNLKARDVPKVMVPGRALRGGGGGVMVQIATLVDDTTGAAQSAALDAVVERSRAQASGVDVAALPFSVDEIPVSIPLTTALRLPTAAAAGTGPMIVGVGGDRSSSHWYDPATTSAGFLVYGPPGSGRTSTLVAMARTAAARGVPVAIVAPKRSALAAEPAALSLVGADAVRPTADALVAHVGAGGVILVDDADRVADDAGIEAALEAADGVGAVVVAGPLEWARGMRGLAAALGDAGVALSPSTTLHGGPLGLTLRSDDTFEGPPGRGLLVIGPAPITVQVPDPFAEGG